MAARTLRRRCRSLVVLGLLTGAVVALVIGALVVARRTATAYDRLATAAAIDDARFTVFGDAGLADEIVAQPGVRSSWTASLMVARVVDAPGLVYAAVLAGPPRPPGLFTPVVVRGRAADDTRVEEVVVTEDYALATGLAPGARLTLWFLTGREVASFDTGFGDPDGARLELRVVGVVRVPGGMAQQPVIGTAALDERLADRSAAAEVVLLRLDDPAGAGALTAAAQQLASGRAAPEGGEEFPTLQVGSPTADRATAAAAARVLWVAMLVFAAVAALGGGLAVTQAWARHHAADRGDQRIESALGLTAGERTMARMLAAAPVALVAALVAVAGALVGARLEPLGGVARYEPTPGWAPNLALGIVGAAAAALAVLVVAALTARRAGAGTPVAGTPPRAMRFAAAARRAELAAAVNLAFTSGSNRRPVPVRSTLAGAVFGMAGVTAALTFASSLDRLVDQPARWGWNADLSVIDARPELLDELDADDRVDELTHARTVGVRIDGRDLTAESMDAVRGAIGWTIIDGRPPRRDDEVVLGALLADELGVAVDDEVTFATDAGAHPFRVVGLGVGPSSSPQSLARTALLTPAGLDLVARSAPFDEAYLRVIDGPAGAAALSDLAARYEVGRPEPPAEVANLADLGNVPELLAAVLGGVAVAALVHALVSTVRRRALDLAVLRAIGFTPAQVRAAVLVSSLAVALCGVVAGVPLGYLVGRFVWWLVADGIGVAGDARLPWVPVLTCAAGAVALALVVAGVPARVATRRAPAAVPRAE